MQSTPVKTPQWELYYNGKEQAARISPWVLSVEYRDPLEGESASMELVLEDKDDLWKNDLLPTKGAVITLALGYQGEPLLQAGDFTVDEIEFSGPPDTVTIRTMAAGIIPSLRTARSAAFENTTLSAIAAKIAKRHGLTIVGQVPETALQRVTQHKETDLAFLRRLANQWGHIFSLRGKKLIWHDRDALDGAAPVTTIERKGLEGNYTFRSKSERVYRAAKVTYWNPKLKKDVTRTISIALEGQKWGGSGDVLTLVERCESLAAAKQKAKAALRTHNGRETEGTFNLFGNPRLIAGVNLKTQGWGKLDGQYQVVKSTHRISRDAGYTTSIDFSLSGAFGMKK